MSLGLGCGRAEGKRAGFDLLVMSLLDPPPRPVARSADSTATGSSWAAAKRFEQIHSALRRSDATASSIRRLSSADFLTLSSYLKESTGVNRVCSRAATRA